MSRTLSWMKKKVFGHLFLKIFRKYICRRVGGGGGGGGRSTQVQRGAAPTLRISRKKGSFLRPPHVRDFVKEGSFFVPRYEVRGLKIPLQSTKYTLLWRRVTPEVTGLRSLPPRNRQRIITSKVKMRVPHHPMSVFWYMKGCLITGKSQFFFYKGAFLAWNRCFSCFFLNW